MSCVRENVRHFAAAEVQDFCAAHGIRVMTDLEVLRDLLEQGPKARLLWRARVQQAAAPLPSDL